jgi:hypothetical protein
MGIKTARLQESSVAVPAVTRRYLYRNALLIYEQDTHCDATSHVQVMNARRGHIAIQPNHRWRKSLNEVEVEQNRQGVEQSMALIPEKYQDRQRDG